MSFHPPGRHKLIHAVSHDSTTFASAQSIGEHANGFPKGYLEPTVIIRANLKARPALTVSQENRVDAPSTSPDSSPNNSGNDLSSGKDSNPRPGDSTGLTSLESQSSSKRIGRSQASSGNKHETSRITIENDRGKDVISSTVEEVQLNEPQQYFTPSK
jgi:hypothetical protein